MVSFVCNYCQQTLKKPKLDQHTQRCHYASFSCIDCGVDFAGTSYRQHTACISEAEKYEGKYYKGKNTPAASKSPSSSSTPMSTVDQLKNKAQEIQQNSEADTKAESDEKAESKKRKHDDLEKSGKKESKKQKKSGEKTESASSWDACKLPSGATEALVLAITHLCESGGIADTSFGDLKKKCIKLVAKHPKSKLSKSDLKSKFEKAVIDALSKGRVSLSKN